MGESNRIIVARADVGPAPFATGGVAGTFVDVGYTKEAASIEPVTGWFDVETEQTLAAVDGAPIKQDWTFKFTLLELKLDMIRQLLNLVSGDLTGVDPNKTLVLNEPWRSGTPQMYQLRFTTKGTKLSTDPAKVRASRTITFWKTILQGFDPWKLAKGDVQALAVTARAYHDESSNVTNGIYGVKAETGGT